MNRIELDSRLSSQFDGLAGPADVFDHHGRKLGQFVPYVDPMASCPYTEEELQAAAKTARANPGQGKTLAQIWKDLGQDELSRAVERSSGGSPRSSLDHSDG